MLLMRGIVVGEFFACRDVAQGDHVEPARAGPQPAVRLATVVGEVVEATVGWQEQIRTNLEDIGVGVAVQPHLRVRPRCSEISGIVDLQGDATRF